MRAVNAHRQRVCVCAHNTLSHPPKKESQLEEALHLLAEEYLELFFFLIVRLLDSVQGEGCVLFGPGAVSQKNDQPFVL